MTTHATQPDKPLSDPPPAEHTCPGPDDPERLAMLDGLKAQIREGLYQPDVRDLARSLATMLVRDL